MECQQGFEHCSTDYWMKLIGVDACFPKGTVACLFWVCPILKIRNGKYKFAEPWMVHPVRTGDLAHYATATGSEKRCWPVSGVKGAGHEGHEEGSLGWHSAVGSVVDSWHSKIFSGRWVYLCEVVKFSVMTELMGFYLGDKDQNLSTNLAELRHFWMIASETGTLSQKTKRWSSFARDSRLWYRFWKHSFLLKPPLKFQSFSYTVVKGSMAIAVNDFRVTHIYPMDSLCREPQTVGKKPCQLRHRDYHISAFFNWGYASEGISKLFSIWE